MYLPNPFTLFLFGLSKEFLSTFFFTTLQSYFKGLIHFVQSFLVSLQNLITNPDLNVWYCGLQKYILTMVSPRCWFIETSPSFKPQHAVTVFYILFFFNWMKSLQPAILPLPLSILFNLTLRSDVINLQELL